MRDHIRLRTFPIDDVRDTKAKYIGLLNESLAKKRLALATTADPAEHLELRGAIADIEAAIKKARQSKELKK